MIMNLWGNGCGVQTVDQHTPGTNLLRYTATWCKAEIEGKHGKCADGYRGGRGRYYLEASRALLDAPSGKFRHLFAAFQGAFFRPSDPKFFDQSGSSRRRPTRSTSTRQTAAPRP